MKNKVNHKEKFPIEGIIIIDLYLGVKIAISHSDLEEGCNYLYFVNIISLFTIYRVRFNKQKFDQSLLINHINDN